MCGKPGYMTIYDTPKGSGVTQGHIYCKEHFDSYLLEHPTVPTNGIWREGSTCEVIIDQPPQISLAS